MDCCAPHLHTTPPPHEITEAGVPHFVFVKVTHITALRRSGFTIDLGDTTPYSVILYTTEGESIRACIASPDLCELEEDGYPVEALDAHTSWRSLISEIKAVESQIPQYRYVDVNVPFLWPEFERVHAHSTGTSDVLYGPFLGRSKRWVDDISLAATIAKTAAGVSFPVSLVSGVTPHPTEVLKRLARGAYLMHPDSRDKKMAVVEPRVQMTMEKHGICIHNVVAGFHALRYLRTRLGHREAIVSGVFKEVKVEHGTLFITYSFLLEPVGKTGLSRLAHWWIQHQTALSKRWIKQDVSPYLLSVYHGSLPNRTTGKVDRPIQDTHSYLPACIKTRMDTFAKAAKDDSRYGLSTTFSAIVREEPAQESVLFEKLQSLVNRNNAEERTKRARKRSVSKLCLAGYAEPREMATCDACRQRSLCPFGDIEDCLGQHFLPFDTPRRPVAIAVASMRKQYAANKPRV